MVRITMMQRDFLWSGVEEHKRDHLISWDIVYKSKGERGLGVGKIFVRNRALLGNGFGGFLRRVLLFGIRLF